MLAIFGGNTYARTLYCTAYILIFSYFRSYRALHAHTLSITLEVSLAHTIPLEKKLKWKPQNYYCKPIHRYIIRMGSIKRKLNFNTKYEETLKFVFFLLLFNNLNAYNIYQILYVIHTQVTVAYGQTDRQTDVTNL